MKLRWPAPHVGAPLESSGRASVRTKSGWLRDQSSRYSTKSRRLSSAHCMSSNTSTVGSVSLRRSKKMPAGREQVLALEARVLGESEELREARLDEGAILDVEDVLVERGARA